MCVRLIVIIVIGTPIQNNLEEIWALFNFCYPKLLSDKNWFKKIYKDPILHGSDENASTRVKHWSSETAKKLRQKIEPYLLRRLKKYFLMEV